MEEPSQSLSSMHSSAARETMAQMAAQQDGDTSADGSLPNPEEELPKHPSERYTRSDHKMDGVSKICTKTIYSAFDNQNAMEVAWIEYRDVPRSVMDRFEESLARLVALDHPHLVKYHTGWADRKAKTLILITEQVTGDLRNWLVKKIEMAPKGTMYQRWIRQLCWALDYLHSNNWVHPDIATSKIFIRGTGELKIGGLAEAFFENVHFADKTFQAGIGAPELALGVRAGPRQNVYQLGLCALHVFTFHHPFKGMQLPQIIKLQQESSFPPELAMIKEKDESLYDLLSGCLETLERRITLSEVLKHPYLNNDSSADGLFSPAPERPEGAATAPAGSFGGGGGAPSPAGVGAGASSTVAGGGGGVGAGANGAANAPPVSPGGPPTTIVGSGPASTAIAATAVPVGVSTGGVVGVGVSGTGGPQGNFTVQKALVVAASPSKLQVVHATAKSAVHTRASIKAYIGLKTPESPCIRVQLASINSLDDLRAVVEEDFREEHLFPEEWTLKYRDADGDLVMITQRTSLEEVLEFAVHLELHPLTKKIPTNLLGDLLNQSDFLTSTIPTSSDSNNFAGGK